MNPSAEWCSCYSSQMFQSTLFKRSLKIWNQGWLLQSKGTNGSLYNAESMPYPSAFTSRVGKYHSVALLALSILPIFDGYFQIITICANLRFLLATLTYTTRQTFILECLTPLKWKIPLLWGFHLSQLADQQNWGTVVLTPSHLGLAAHRVSVRDVGPWLKPYAQIGNTAQCCSLTRILTLHSGWNRLE